MDRKRKKKGSNDEWKSPSDPDARITGMKDGRIHLAHKSTNEELETSRDQIPFIRFATIHSSVKLKKPMRYLGYWAILMTAGILGDPRPAWPQVRPPDVLTTQTPASSVPAGTFVPGPGGPYRFGGNPPLCVTGDFASEYKLGCAPPQYRG